MNDMAIALVDAGVRVPSVKQRVWMWLHDHPEKTVDDICKSLKLINSRVSTALWLMQQKGMVERIPNTRTNARANSSVWKAVGQTYVDSKIYGRIAPKLPANTLAPVAEVRPPLVKGIDIDSLTIRKARELFNQLKRIFTA